MQASKSSTTSIPVNRDNSLQILQIIDNIKCVHHARNEWRLAAVFGKILLSRGLQCIFSGFVPRFHSFYSDTTS